MKKRYGISLLTNRNYLHYHPSTCSLQPHPLLYITVNHLLRNPSKTNTDRSRSSFASTLLTLSTRGPRTHDRTNNLDGDGLDLSNCDVATAEAVAEAVDVVKTAELA